MAKKNLYENNNPKLRELKQLRSIPEMAKEIRRMAKQINQRYYRLEKKGKERDTAYIYSQKETGREKPRYTENISKLENMSLQELYELGIQINAKLVSKTTTISGQKEIEKHRISVGMKELFGNDTVNEEEWKKFLRNGGGELMNNRWMSSYQVAEDWREFTQQGGVSVKEFINLYNEYKEKEDIDQGEIRRRLINLNRKKN